MRQFPEFVLTLGVDASGKTSFITKLSQVLGYTVLEPTHSKVATDFKKQHADNPVDSAFVHERRNLFRNLNIAFDARIREELKEHRVITTGHRLTTDISHAVMAKIVGDEDFSVEDIIEEWKADAPLIPDEIVFTHAPLDVIHSRIQARLANGNTGEQMSGFNSIYFLDHYQQALLKATQVLAQEIPVMSGDTSKISIEAGVSQFIQRNQI